MNFDELDQKMRIYENSLDQVILPDFYLAARIDGRSFTRLTKELYPMKVPFDETFRDKMIETVKHLMNCGFRIVYGYTESDEISLLFHKDEQTFGRKTRKYNSILAGEGSAAFSLLLGGKACFDCRMIPLPNLERVKDYFLWRQEDAHRNSLNAHCYWMLRKKGLDADQATKQLEGKSISYKNELLFSNGINYDKLPNWHKRGIGIYSVSYKKEGYNPIANKTEYADRKKLTVNLDLPIQEEYSDLIVKLLTAE